jgi:hypothetical protein
MWATVFERLRRIRPGPASTVAAAAATSALAYVVDYKAVPQRLQPGFDVQVPRATLGAFYVAFAAALAAAAWSAARRSPARARDSPAEDGTALGATGFHWTALRAPRCAARACTSSAAAGTQRRVHVTDHVSVDFAADVSDEDWLPRLDGVDVVVNAVGIAAERPRHLVRRRAHACAARAVQRMRPSRRAGDPDIGARRGCRARAADFT